MLCNHDVDENSSSVCMGCVETNLDGTLAARATQKNAASLESMAFAARSAHQENASPPLDNFSRFSV